MSQTEPKRNSRFNDAFVIYAIRAYKEYKNTKIVLCPDGAIDEELSEMRLKMPEFVSAIASKMNQPYTSVESLQCCVRLWVKGTIRPTEYGGYIPSRNTIRWKKQVHKTGIEADTKSKEYHRQYYHIRKARDAIK